MLYAIFLLFFCNLAGEALVRGADVPIPGPVLGLVILALGLIVDRRLRPAAADLNSNAVGKTADSLLGVLGLLMVPAGVGIVQKLGIFRQYGFALAVVIAGSVVITLMCAVFSFLLTERLLYFVRRNGKRR